MSVSIACYGFSLASHIHLPPPLCHLLWTPPPFTPHQDGVVLAADTRSTSGSTVADKNCEKIHYIAPNIYCCGAGTAADTENVTGAA
jgi:20S proteasome subunit beta 2